MICTSLSPPNTHLTHFPSFSCSHQFFPTRFFDCPATSQVHGCLKASPTSCSLCLETPVHMLSPFSLHRRARPSQDHQFDILYTYVYVYSFIFSQENVSCMKKGTFVLFIDNYIIRTMPYLKEILNKYSLNVFLSKTLQDFYLFWDWFGFCMNVNG